MNSSFCLIKQSECGRSVGIEPCQKCGLDSRVRYTDEDAAFQAKQQALIHYWQRHSEALQNKLQTATTRLADTDIASKFQANSQLSDLSYSNQEARLIKIIAVQLGINEAVIERQSSFTEDLGAD